MSGLEQGLTLGAVLGASLLGSVHCVGMCGGFVTAICSAPPTREAKGTHEGRGRRTFAPLIAYQLTRGAAYVGLGALGGLLGAGLDASASLVGLQRLAGPLMGLTLIVMAIVALRAGPQQPASPLITLARGRARPSPLAALRLRLARTLAARSLEAGAAAGLLSALLPCGWLWAYVLVAASTGLPGRGALVMLCFWLGSVPALSGVGLLADQLRRRLGRHAPRITAAAMLGLGVLALVGKLAPHPTPAPAPAPDPSELSPTPEPASLPTTAPCH